MNGHSLRLTRGRALLLSAEMSPMARRLLEAAAAKPAGDQEQAETPGGPLAEVSQRPGRGKDSPKASRRINHAQEMNERSLASKTESGPAAGPQRAS